MRHYTTHIDVESGGQISLPSAGYYPPVNDKIRGLKVYGKTTGGEGTPAVPVPLVSTPSGLKLTSCKENLWDNKTMWDAIIAAYPTKASYATYDSKSCVKINSLGMSPFRYGFKSNTQYRFKLSYYQATNAIPVLFIRYTDTTTSCHSMGTVGAWASLNALSTANKTINFIGWSYTNAGDTYLDCDTFQITEGTADTAHTAFNGTTYPYLIKDTSDILHEGNSLPDGTADSYDRDNNLFTQRIDKVVLNGTELWYVIDSAMVGTHRFYMNILNLNLIGNEIKIRATHFKPELFETMYEGLGEINCVATWSGYNRLYVRIEDSILGIMGVDDSATKVSKFKTWLISNIVTVLYKLAVPQTFPLKPYNASTFPYNQIPMSVQYINNVFTDAVTQPTIQGEFRKLGNRALAEYQLYTSDGDVLQAIPYNHMIDSSFSSVNAAIVTNNKYKEFTVTASYVGDSMAAFAEIDLPAGEYTLRRTFEVLAGTPITNETGKVRIVKVSGGSTIITIMPDIANGTFMLDTSGLIKCYFYLSYPTELVDLLSVKFSNVYLQQGTLLYNLFVRI